MGSVQLIFGMGAIISLLQLIFGPDRIRALWLLLGCAGAWWVLACVYGGATPE